MTATSIDSQMNYSIPWKLLGDDDAEFLDSCKAERHPVGLAFKQDLSRDKIVSIFLILCNLRTIVQNPDDNHINFAIGDTIIEYGRLFGESEKKAFVEKWARLSKLRDRTHQLSGSVLFYIQTIEHLIRGCCALLDLKGLNLTLEDFQSPDGNRRRQTLGQLKCALVGTSAFSQAFEKQFDEFVKSRNKFVHSIWIDHPPTFDEDGLPESSYFIQKLEFTARLAQNASQIQNVFHGLLGMIVETLGGHVKDEGLLRLKRYIPECRGAFRANTSSKNS